MLKIKEKLYISKKAFSLVEILVVLAIIGILISVAIIGINGAQIASRNSIRAQAISSINTDIQSYFNTHHYYPSDILFENQNSSCTGSANLGNVCFTIYQPINFPNVYTWIVQPTILKQSFSAGGSGFDGYPNPSNFTSATQTQYFYFNDYVSSSSSSGVGGYPLGYTVGFCKEGGGVFYLSGGKSPTVTVTSTGINVTPRSGYGLWGDESLPLICK